MPTFPRSRCSGACSRSTIPFPVFDQRVSPGYPLGIVLHQYQQSSSAPMSSSQYDLALGRVFASPRACCRWFPDHGGHLAFCRRPAWMLRRSSRRSGALRPKTFLGGTGRRARHQGRRAINGIIGMGFAFIAVVCMIEVRPQLVCQADSPRRSARRRLVRQRCSSGGQTRRCYPGGAAGSSRVPWGEGLAGRRGLVPVMPR